MIARLISRHGFSDANSSSTDDMAQFLPQDDGSALISDLVYRQPSLPASSAAQTDSSESSSVPGRADFGSATPVRTGIPDTTSVGTTGNFVNQDINGILSGSAWNVTNVTYSFPTSASFYGSGYSDPAPANGFQTLSAAQQAVAEYAFSLISQYTPLTFTQITETSTTHAMIRLADSSYPATSYAYYPAASDTGGDVFYGNIRNDTPTKAGYAFDTILHEIGHAVGLKHGQDDDGTHGVLPSSHDSTEWSIMDYHPYIGGPLYYSNSDGSGNQTYMTDDISALQYLYGANFNSNSSNTVYTWSPTTGQEFINGIGQGASSTDTVYEAIWDGNGIDTYDLSNYTTSLSIDLQPGDWSTFSSTQLANLDSGAPGVHLAPGNIINANEYNNDARSLIENADGGSGNDTLVGNTANNVLRGGAGNDSLYGGAGTDTAVFSGTQSQYTVTWTSGTNYTVVGPDGSDQLHDIELVQFGAAAPVAIGVAADDYRGDASTTGTLTAGGSVNAVINFAGDTDWFRTTLTAGTTYWFNDEGSPTGQGTLPDTFLRLLNSTSVQVATDDDSGAGLNSFISYTPTTTGTYYVSAQAFGSNTGTYRLSERVADDYTGNPATTGTLAAGGSVSANISFNGDTDWFRTTLTAGTTYWFNDEGSATGQGTLSDPLLRLLSNDGATQVSSNDDSGAGLNSFISYTPTATGTYYLSAQAFGGNTGTYRLSEQVADDYAGNPSSTGALAVGSNVAATINFAGDTDWFHTSLTAGTTYWFSEEGSPTGQGTLPDTYLRLLSNDGATLVSSNDDSGVGFNSFVSYTPTVTGTYYLSAQAFGTNTGTYHLSETVADDYAGNPATTGTLAAGGSVSANISFNGDTDWFRTTLTAGTTYWFNDEGSPTGQGTLSDPLLRLLSNDGATLVTSNDDSGAGLNSFISYTPTATGTYYLSAQAFGANTGTYRLSEQVADDYAGNPATTGALAAGGSVGANISFNGDTDWFRTTLTAGTTYWFNDEGSATGQGTLSDPLLRLLSNDGATQVSSNDDSGAGLNSFISYTPTATGTYYLSAQAFGGNTGTYRLSEQVADDYAGNPSSTGALAVGSNVAATINFAGDTDWFHTSLTAGTTYWFSEEGSPTGQGTLPDTYLRLLSNDGATLVSSNDDSGVGFNSFVSYTPTVTGTYYLSAQAFGTNTGTYHLSETVADDYAGNPATTGTLAAGGSVSANISFNGDTDWFRTTLTAGTTYVINDEGSPTGQGTLPDTYLRLLSNDGATLVASDDDGGVGTNSLITYTPTVTGTYYLSAQAFGSNTGTYRLSEATAGPAQLSSSSNRMSFIGGSDSLLASSTTIPTSNGTTLSSESTSIPFPHGVAIESFSAVTPTTQELWQVSGAGSAAGLDHGAPPSASSPVVDLSQTTSVSMLATHQLG